LGFSALSSTSRMVMTALFVFTVVPALCKLIRKEKDWESRMSQSESRRTIILFKF
jgi:hypothetical protein